MAEKKKWIAFSWYCQYCGNKVTGYRSTGGSTKARCSKCGALTVRTGKGPGHDTFEVYDLGKPEKTDITCRLN